uniref:Mitotic spindle organizing protein 1 n=1 Tax=Amphiprion ocellaris TaxID=80972 RepID=A0AAQ5XMM5_AMPOC
MASAANANVNAVRETMDVLLEISRLLNTGLDMESLSICVRLCEQGINPEALSAVIKELRKASESLKKTVTEIGEGGTKPAEKKWLLPAFYIRLLRTAQTENENRSLQFGTY